jgi:hypothetical protein
MVMAEQTLEVTAGAARALLVGRREGRLVSDDRDRSSRAPAPLPGHDDRQRRRHALKGHRQLAAGLNLHGAGCGHRGARACRIADPRQVEVRAAPSYATQMNGLADEQDLRLRFDVLTKTKQPELCRYWTTRDRAANVRLFRLAAEVLQAIEAGVFHPNPGWQCKDCQFRSQCWAWR